MTAARPSNRRSCSCGAGLVADGPIGVADLLAAFDRRHTGPGHQPVRRALSEEGRAPRTKSPRREGRAG